MKGLNAMQTMNPDIFATVPEKDFLSLYKEKRPQYNRIAEFLDFKKEDVARATGVAQSSVRYDEKMPLELKERIQEWAVLFNLVAGHFQGNALKTAQWFSTLNPLLGNVSPKDMIRLGRYKKLLSFVMNALAENRHR